MLQFLGHRLRPHVISRLTAQPVEMCPKTRQQLWKLVKFTSAFIPSDVSLILVSRVLMAAAAARCNKRSCPEIIANSWLRVWMVFVVCGSQQLSCRWPTYTCLRCWCHGTPSAAFVQQRCALTCKCLNPSAGVVSFQLLLTLMPFTVMYIVRRRRIWNDSVWVHRWGEISCCHCHCSNLQVRRAFVGRRHFVGNVIKACEKLIAVNLLLI